MCFSHKIVVNVNTDKLQREKLPRLFKSFWVSLVLQRFLLVIFVGFPLVFSRFRVTQSVFSVCSRDPESVFLSAVSLVSAMPVLACKVMGAYFNRRCNFKCFCGYLEGLKGF